MVRFLWKAADENTLHAETVSESKIWSIHKTDKTGRILVVEDNAINQGIMRIMLKTMNLEFEIVDNGKKAVDAVAESDYSMVLMDLQMPIMDGFEATQIIRKDLGPGGLPPLLQWRQIPGKAPKKNVWQTAWQTT